ncbi:hypothetical protein [Metabacillus iocasae]|uniref:Peptidase M50 domain-containing protein n=1 Tax=Priestia iocasae TaxID=2291674 RepID=A0ABS2QYG9_9BACI|nr:hypothetical protein [Metabacillus iocasae]MBM7704288.1 hypothetical protein [Metabacillus iocasae]
MFNAEDLQTFFWGFFLILPIVSLIHQSGHIAFAALFGGNISLTLGRGSTLFKIGPLEVKKIYFLDSFCNYSNLKVDNRFSHACIYAGGSLFNMLSVLMMNVLIMSDILSPHLFFYQFGYFSFYFAFFSLLPVQYSDKHMSDGKAIYTVLRYGKACDPID